MEDGFEYPPPDDEADERLARSQEALQQAGQHRDEVLSEEAQAMRAYGDPPEDPFAAKRESLGFDLAWWAEHGEHGTPPLDIVVDLANQACGRTHYMRDLERFDYDPSTSIGEIALDAVTGPLVVAGLQILGTLHSHIRDEIEAVLKTIYDAVPDATDENTEAFAVAAEKLQAEQLNAMGIQVVGMDDFLGLDPEREGGPAEDDDEPPFDASSN